MDKKQYKFLEWGYKTAIALSLISLISSSAYLFYFLFKSNPENIKLETMVGFSAERRMVLLSTGIFVAMAFGFLGFALFLIQAKGEIEGSFEHQNTKVSIARMSPGIFAMLCATVIIIVCITFKIEYRQQGSYKDLPGLENTPAINNDIIPDAAPTDTANTTKECQPQKH